MEIVEHAVSTDRHFLPSYFCSRGSLFLSNVRVCVWGGGGGAWAGAGGGGEEWGGGWGGGGCWSVSFFLLWKVSAWICSM